MLTKVVEVRRLQAQLVQAVHVEVLQARAEELHAELVRTHGRLADLLADILRRTRALGEDA